MTNKQPLLSAIDNNWIKLENYLNQKEPTMDFNLTAEQQMVRDTTREFVKRECPDNFVREWDEKDDIPSEVFGRLARLGFCGWTIPKEYGGLGRDILAAVIVEEELTRQWPALGWLYCMAAFFGGEYIARLGSERQKQKYLPGIASGNLLFSYALTEPNAGSDLEACQTSATESGDGFILNGQKTYITGADITHHMLMLVRTSKSLPKRQAFTMFIVDRKSDGLTVRRLKKLGYKGSSCVEVFLNSVKVARENILGGPEAFGNGWEQVLQTLVIEHIHIGADGVGIAQGAFDRAIAFAKERVQFGQPIGKFQAISHMLAEMATEIQAARLLVYYATRLVEQDKPSHMESAMAKYYATEVAKKVALAGMQIAGGYGYMMESDLQRYVRDSLVLTIGGGTTQIQKEIIAGVLGL